MMVLLPGRARVGRSLDHLEHHRAGQAAAAGRVMRAVARHWRRLGIRRLMWYTWLTPAASSADWTQRAGLNKLVGGALVPKPALRAHRRVALRLEGRR